MVSEKSPSPTRVKRSPFAAIAEQCWDELCARFPTIETINAEVAIVILAETIRKGGGPRRDKNDIPPHPDMVRAYVAEIGADFDPEAFCDYYALRDWCVSVGKVAQKMTDWKAAARLWKREGWGVQKKRPQIIERFSEWEIKTKQERIQALKSQIREMRYPGGCAYACELAGDKLLKAQLLQSEIETIQRDLRTTL
jgi:hypothetical protein